MLQHISSAGVSSVPQFLFFNMRQQHKLRSLLEELIHILATITWKGDTRKTDSPEEMLRSGEEQLGISSAPSLRAALTDLIINISLLVFLWD